MGIFDLFAGKKNVNTETNPILAEQGPGIDIGLEPEYEEVEKINDDPTKSFQVRFDVKEGVPVFDDSGKLKIGLKGYGRTSVKVIHPADYYGEDPEAKFKKKIDDIFTSTLREFSGSISKVKIASMKGEIEKRMKENLEKAEIFVNEVDIIYLAALPVSPSASVPGGAADKPKRKKCPYCGSFSDFDVNVCNTCGAKFVS